MFPFPSDDTSLTNRCDGTSLNFLQTFRGCRESVFDRYEDSGANVKTLKPLTQDSESKSNAGDADICDETNNTGTQLDCDDVF